MIKTKAFSTFIICSILISSISHSYILGGDDEEGLINGDGKKTQASSSLCTWRNAGKAFIGLLALGGAAFGGYEYGKRSNAPQTSPFKFNHPAIPLKPNKPPLICPAVIPLNGKHNNCSSEDTQYWPGAHMGEAAHSEEWIPGCTPQPDMEQNSFKAPKIFVVDAKSPHLKSLLDKMLANNVPYYMGGFASGFGGKAFLYYVYDSKEGFVVPTKHFTVAEIEDDPEAMKVIKYFFEFQNDFNPTPCHEFILGEE